MKNAFRFKQFTVYQDLAAMKVGTDGVLLGAWANVNKAQNILDIGTGSGLIALMLAQRNKSALIDAIEINKDACQQAKYNFEISPWKQRLTAVHTSLQKYKTNKRYDIIVSNPPFFDENVPAKNQARQTARHSDSLNLTELLNNSLRLLSVQGQIFLILPKNKETELLDIAQQKELYPQQIVDVKGTKTSPVKRILVALSKQELTCKHSELIIEISRHHYTAEYIRLTKEYYLKM
jgi:tRNA1Val (adenine37-N6)-methyltransferase